MCVLVWWRRQVPTCAKSLLTGDLFGDGPGWEASPTHAEAGGGMVCWAKGRGAWKADGDGSGLRGWSWRGRRGRRGDGLGDASGRGR